MKYGLIIKQRGQGCDYTIGCGEKFMVLRAATLEGARAEAKLIVWDWLVDADKPSQPSLDFARLLMIEEELPIDEGFHEMRAAPQEAQLEAIEAEERAEYKRLKKKYGG